MLSRDNCQSGHEKILAAALRERDDAIQALERAQAELAEMRKEVREWICLECRHVYPGPPQEGVKCVVCPRCGGNTVKHGGDSPWRFRAEQAEAGVKELKALLSGRTISCGRCNDAESKLQESQAALQKANDEIESLKHGL